MPGLAPRVRKIAISGRLSVTIITKEEAANSDFNLSPARHVQLVGATEGRDLSVLVTELKRLDAESRVVGVEIEVNKN